MADAKRVYIPYKPELMELRDRGFGDLRGDKLLFTVRVLLPPREAEDTHLRQTQRARTRTARLGPQVLSWETGNLDKVSGLQGPSG